MKPAKPIHLEIGIGSARRIMQVASQRRDVAVVGIDKRPNAVKKRIQGARLVLGKKGEAKTFLRDAIRRGLKFHQINAEYFFDSVVPEVDFWASVGRGIPFQRIFDETDKRNAKRDLEIKETLGLIKRVLDRDGFLRLEVRKDSVRKNIERLERNGFKTQTRKLKPEEIESWWGKMYLKQAKEGGRTKQPFEIIAWVR